jgi:hypothetical protein
MFASEGILLKNSVCDEARTFKLRKYVLAAERCGVASIRPIAAGDPRIGSGTALRAERGKSRWARSAAFTTAGGISGPWPESS